MNTTKMTKLRVIPMPKNVIGEKEDGSFDRIGVLPRIYTECAEWQVYADAFADLAEKVHGVTFEAAEGGIRLCRKEQFASGEYYIEGADAVLYASDDAGITYALSSLLQMLECENGNLTLPTCDIQDKPDSPFRALMVDLSRQWHPFERLFEYVDLCYLYKINYLHLHFIDTQTYTLPSDVFPLLPTEGRSYTKEQIAELNAYALTRHVELIPEIEVPGHAAAMVNAYPELFANTPDGESSENSYTLVNDTHKNNIICIGKPGIMDNIKKIVCEILEMFPHSRYLHIGGDEATISDWETCRDCKRYMKEHGIPNVRHMYSRFVKDMTDLVLALGVTPIVWEGFPKEGSEDISRDVLVIAWESYYQFAPDLLEAGFDLINASWQPLYIVPSKRRRWDYKDILAWNVYNWQHWYPKSEAHLNPIHVQPTEKVKGGLLCAWECTYEQEIERVRENLAAMSERTWNIRRYAEDEEFREKLDAILPLARSLALKGDIEKAEFSTDITEYV
jgi:hexosaminidase